MKLVIDAGHGKDYRKPGDTDYGLLAEDGSTELGIGEQYASRLRGEADIRGLKKFRTSKIRSGGVSVRLRFALSRKGDVLVSFHMAYDESALPGGRILYATEDSRKVAEAVSRELKLPVEQVPEDHGLLRYNRSIEIELGNIVCVPQMRDLKAVSYCTSRCNAILDALETL